MKEVFYGIAEIFELIFNVVEALENIPNYFYILIIFAFLVVWTIKMLQHRKNNEEHASS